VSIIGIESAIYGVDDVATCTRFFDDYGLPLVSKSAEQAHFRLEEGSNVVLRQVKDAAIPRSGLQGIGVHETIWGVDGSESLESLVASLAKDHQVQRDPDGTAHVVAPFGLAYGLRVFRKTQVYSAPDPVNSPGRINRFNQLRKWKTRARPKTLIHVVYQVPDTAVCRDYFIERLNFRLSDRQDPFGFYLRADGAQDHHNIFFLNAHLPFPGFDGKLRFDHANFGVEDFDEVMIGANYMERHGWPKSDWGVGRHRISSAVFNYLPCPAGGAAEYGADQDMIDDSWIPRQWKPAFGSFVFVHNIPPFAKVEPPWDVDFAPGYTPQAKPKS